MSANELNEICCNIKPILRAINLMLEIVKWSVPLLLIVLGTIDMFKAVLSGDEKVVKETQESFIKRLLYGVLIFLIPFLVDLVLTLISENITVDNQGLTDMNSWAACWKPAVNNELTCVVEEVPEDNEQIPDNENIDNGNTNTKICYGWIDSANCNTDEFNRLSNNIEDYYPAKIESPRLVGSKCQVILSSIYSGGDIKKYPNSICSRLNGTYDYSSKTCSYDAILTSDYSDSKPSSTFDGKVDVYTCPMSVTCSNIGLCDKVRQESVATR